MATEALFVSGLTLLTDDRGRLHFWGEVFNLGDITRRWVRITLRLLDARGGVLAEQSDIAGLEWTLPGARNPFYIRFLNPPEGWYNYDIRLSSQVHDYNDLSVPQPHPGVLVEKVHYREIGRADLRCSLIGLLVNRGLAPATHVKAAGTLYSAEGKVTGALTPYLVSRGALAPGDSFPFELKFYALGGTVANYAIQVQGRMAQET
jgi:hypothetical protein